MRQNRSQNSSRNIQTGFTITEVLTAVVILALVVLIAVPVYRNYIADSQTVDAINALEAVRLEVRAPAKARNGLQQCDNTLVIPKNLESNYLTLDIGATPNDRSNPQGDLGFAAALMVTATSAQNGTDGIAIAKRFHEEVKNNHGGELVPGIVSDSVVNFGIVVSIPGEPFCDVGGGSSVSTASKQFNRPPVAPTDIDIGTTLEDTALQINTGTIISSSWDPDGDTLSVSTITGSNGSISGDASSGFTFTPSENYSGSANITFTISDGTDTAQGSGRLLVSPDTDLATTSIRVQVERIAFGLQGGDDDGSGGAHEGWIKPVGDRLNTGGDMDSVTAEFVYAHDPSIHIGIYQDFAAYGEGDSRFSLWTGGTNLNLSHNGKTTDTGINMNDGNDHRVTLSWSKTDNIARIFDNGILAKEVPNFIPAGTDIKGNSLFNAGSKFLPGKYSGSDQFVGKLLSLGMVNRALSAAEIGKGPVYTVADKNSGLLFDLRSSPTSGRIEDQTGKNPFELQNEKLTPNQLSDITSTAPGLGDKLHVSYSVTAPKDPSDTITSISIGGFINGTIVSTASGNTTATNSSSIDLTGNLTGSFTATLPATSANSNLTLTVVTEGPSAKSATATATQAIVMDARQPVN